MAVKVISIESMVIPLEEDPIAGVPAGVYVFLVHLAGDDALPEYYVLVSVYHPPINQSAFVLITEQVRVRENSCIVYFIADSPGHAVVVSAPDRPKTLAFNIAAVTAVVKA